MKLIEKVSVLREHLLALNAVATDIKKLAELSHKKYLIMRGYYVELRPYMTLEQRSRADCLTDIEGSTEFGLATDKGNNVLTDHVTKTVPRMIADLDDVAEKLQQQA